MNLSLSSHPIERFKHLMWALTSFDTAHVNAAIILLIKQSDTKNLLLTEEQKTLGTELTTSMVSFLLVVFYLVQLLDRNRFLLEPKEKLFFIRLG